MFKLYTNSFKNNSNLMKSFLKNTNLIFNEKSRFMYLNFSNSYAYLKNSEYSIRFKFDFEGYSRDDLYIDLEFFINIIPNYDFFDLTKDNYFVSEKDKFKIPELNEKNEDTYLDFDITDFDTYEVSNDNILLLMDAAKFRGEDTPESKYNGVGIREKSFRAANDIQAFETNHNSKLYSINLPPCILDLLPFFRDASKINFYNSKNTNYIFINDGEIEIAFFSKEELRLPSFSDTFIKRYNHPDSIVFDRKAAVNIFTTLAPFAERKRNEVVIFSIESLTEAKLTVTDEVSVELYLPLISCSQNLMGVSLPIMRKEILKFISFLEEDQVLIQVPTDPKAAAINIRGLADAGTHLVLLLLSEDTM